MYKLEYRVGLRDELVVRPGSSTHRAEVGGNPSKEKSGDVFRPGSCASFVTCDHGLNYGTRECSRLPRSDLFFTRMGQQLVAACDRMQSSGRRGVCFCASGTRHLLFIGGLGRRDRQRRKTALHRAALDAALELWWCYGRVLQIYPAQC